MKMSNSFDTIEIVCSALVREYLSTKGFSATLKHMDFEYPRSKQSINSRQTLARALGFRRPSRGQGAILESLVRRLLIQKSVTSYSCKESLVNSDICSSTYNFPPAPKPFSDVNTQDADIPLFKEKNDEKSRFQNISPTFDEGITETQHSAINNTDADLVEKDDESLMKNSSNNYVETLSILPHNFTECSKELQIESLSNLQESSTCEEIIIDEDIANAFRQNSEISVKNEVPFEEPDDQSSEHYYNNNNQLKNSRIIRKVKEIQGQTDKTINKELMKSVTICNPSEVHVNEIKLQHEETSQKAHVEYAIPLEFDIDKAAGDQEDLLAGTLLVPPVPDGATPLALPAALQLKTLIFGDSEAQFPSVWKEEGILFNKSPKLGYGLELNKEGPCGALAALQGFVLKALLFSNISPVSNDNIVVEALNPSPEKARCALIIAVSDVLWQCGQRRQACLAIPAGDGGALLAGNGRYRRDGVTEALRLLYLESLEDAREAVERHVSLLQAPGGCALFLCSAILSRGLTQTAEDMGDACAPLLVRGGECAPELVSLVLTGRASMRDEKHGDERLRNVPARADIGLLTLAEYYGHCKVGSFLKTPRYPIWLVLAQGHYSVLFSTRRQLVSDWRAELAFRLHLYTGTAQRRPLQLAVETGEQSKEDGEDERALSPVEMVIRTKWTGASMKWID